MDEYLCRICWNSRNWERPSGEGRLLETKGLSYLADNGFGHEEWLFDYRWLIDGWKFGYLQSLSRANRDLLNAMQNEPVKIYLFARMRDGACRCFARIEKAWVPTKEEAVTAAMRDQEIRHAHQVADLRAVLDDSSFAVAQERLKSEQGELTWINVKFRPEDVTLFNHPFEISLTSNRYQTYVWDPSRFIPGDRNQLGILEMDGAIPQAFEDPTLKTQVRKGPSEVLVKLMHDKIQALMRRWLKETYPDYSVSETEIDNVDITLWINERHKVFFEIKTAPDPRSCIREALGQILEYNHYGASNLSKAHDLVIVGPEEPGPREQEYIRTLRTRYKLPLTYASVNLETGELKGWVPLG
ncbi:MAG: hypothetical protein IPF72_20175 [Chitinophagaceae bacterium]|nr:hypothetical protein [Chitinophagaceae bacterium]